MSVSLTEMPWPEPTYRLRIDRRRQWVTAGSVGLRHKAKQIEAVIDQQGRVLDAEEYRLWRCGKQSRLYFQQPTFTGGLTILFTER